MDKTLKVALRNAPLDGPQVARVFGALKIRIEQRCPLEVIEAAGDPQIILAIDAQLPPEAFRIDQVDGAVRVAGGSPRGLLYGVGKFLRTSRYADGFTPSPWRGTSAPHGTLRGMYFANHFHNWYHVAGDEEVARYVEDLVAAPVRDLPLPVGDRRPVPSSRAPAVSARSIAARGVLTDD